jgi:F420-dependent oxidoreductase-like protein
MRFGFKMPHQSTTWSALADVWRAGDELDVLESAWTYDHLVGLQATPGEIELAPAKPMLDGWSLLAALATQTRRLRIGNLVTCVPFRHPVVLAKMVTTIDEIAGGRLELGLGAGWMEPEAAMFGTELGSVRDRLDRLEEAIEVIIRLLATDAVDYDGRFYRLAGARIEPKVQRPRPRIWIGGNGEKRTLRIVARYADAWNYTALRPGGELDVFRAKCDILADRCAEIGRDPADVLVTAQLSLGSDAHALADLAGQWGAAGAEYVIVMLPEGATPSVLEDLALALEPLRHLHERRG